MGQKLANCVSFLMGCEQSTNHWPFCDLQTRHVLRWANDCTNVPFAEDRKDDNTQCDDIESSVGARVTAW